MGDWISCARTMGRYLPFEAADVSNKENLLLSSAMSTLQKIFESSFLVFAIVEKKQLVTQWIKEFNN